MTDMLLTERQKNELEFYEEFSKCNPPSQVRFDPISGKDPKPWNSYWYVMDVVKQNFKGGASKLLDFGCGTGANALLFSKMGFEVFGFDISPNNVCIAESMAEKYGVKDRTHFSVGVAEHLDYPDSHFDVVVGIDILHHVNISEALTECSRVLKPGGVAIFHEPLRVPVLDTLRETRFGRWLVPKERSLARHITEDERKLTPEDLEIIKRFDPGVSAQRFVLLSRLDRFIRSPKYQERSVLEKTDSKLFRLFPPLRTFGGIIVLVLKKRG